MEENKGYKRGLWTEEEDKVLIDYIKVHGKGRWNRVAKMTGLKRCGKSCRLRWLNYLSPSIKHGDFSEEEDDLIIRLHNLLGNRWSLIAGRVPGRTDNQVKNHWNTHLSKKIGAINKKQKQRTKPQSFPQTQSTEPKEHTNIVSMDSNSNIYSFNFVEGEGEKDFDKNGSLREIRIFETTHDENEQNPLWFWNEVLNTSSSSLLELWDPCSLDFVWQKP